MKIVMISGFLGAGKTSFIKEMVKKTQRQFVIVENEFGELGLDGKLLKKDMENGNISENAEMKIWELTEGCICCSLNLDFSHSVMTISNVLDPDYLIVEPSGVALPSRIIKQLNKITYDKIRFSAPITIIDGSHYQESRKNFSEYFEDQLKVAGTVAVSKSENFSYGDFERIKKELKIAENIDFSMTHYSNWSREKWFEMLDKEMIVVKDENKELAISFQNAVPKVKESLDNVSAKKLNIRNIDELAHMLFLLTTGYFGKIVRAKGYCKLGGFWVKFDLVESEFAITGCEDMEDERVVVIGKNIKKDEILDMFTKGFN